MMFMLASGLSSYIPDAGGRCYGLKNKSITRWNSCFSWGLGFKLGGCGVAFYKG